MDIKNITEGIIAIKELIALITKLGEETNNLTLQKAILELDKKNYALEKEILDLKKELDKKDTYNLEFNDNCYWNIKRDGTKDGPFCSKCYDTSEKLVRMLNYHSKGMYKCPNCNIQIKTSEYVHDDSSTFMNL